jgi:hypothetical protein
MMTMKDDALRANGGDGRQARPGRLTVEVDRTPNGLPVVIPSLLSPRQ